MQWSKFSLITLFFFISTASFAEVRFTSKQCLEASFNSDIQAEGQFFGLLKNDFKINKDKCIITVNYKRVLETEWIIDVCREPIHMKVTSKGSQSVYKRLAECQHANESDFCKSWKELKTLIEDRALIFAEGQRELLSTSHGQVYCSYTLLKKHLDEGILFSLFDELIDLNPAPIIKEEKIETPPEESTTIKPENPTEARF